MQKRILITGITGFAGSHLMDYLLQNTDAKIFGLKRVNSRLRNIRHALDKITLIDADLLDETSLIYALRQAHFDQIYHLGALSWVTPSWNSPSVYMQTNAIGTINLFEAMRLTGCTARVLTSATPEEFGDVPQELIPITEETRLQPINPYAASKAAQDMICITYHASYGINIVRTRAFNHEGPRRDIHGAVASFAYQLALIEQGKKEPVIEVGNLEATRNFTDVRDTVYAYYLAMEKGESGELYLIGSDQIFTMREVLDKLIDLSPQREQIKIRVDPARIRPTELRTFIGNFSKFRNKTGWEIHYSLNETLRQVLQYWRMFAQTENPFILD
jgi:GDP-4-dehydro-6-deoxy-D-mannose reductase